MQRRQALPYTTQPAIPIKQRKRFEQDIQEFTAQRFPELQKLCTKVKPEDQRELDWLCEEVESLVKAVESDEREYSVPIPTYHLNNALRMYQIMVDAEYEKFKWLGYYIADLERAVEDFDKVQEHYFPEIIKGITYLMKSYFGNYDWDIEKPTVVPNYPEDLDEFFGEADWNPAAVLAELDRFVEVSDRVKEGVKYEKAWYEYLSKKSGEQYSTKSEKIFPPGVENLEVMWHVTTAYSTVLREGFKTKRQLREEGIQPGGVGGGQENLISFTASYEHAQGIQDGILDLVEMAHNPPTAQQIIDKFRELGLSDEGLQKGIEYYNSSWGGSLKDFDAPMEFKRSLDLYRPLMMFAQGEGLVYDPFFSGPDEEVYKNIDPEDVQIVEAVVDTTDEETTYHWAEEEWRIPPKNILSVGPVGSQEAVLEKLKSERAASVVLHQGEVYQREARTIHDLTEDYLRVMKANDWVRIYHGTGIHNVDRPPQDMVFGIDAVGETAVSKYHPDTPGFHKYSGLYVAPTLKEARRWGTLLFEFTVKARNLHPTNWGAMSLDKWDPEFKKRVETNCEREYPDSFNPPLSGALSLNPQSCGIDFRGGEPQALFKGIAKARDILAVHYRGETYTPKEFAEEYKKELSYEPHAYRSKGPDPKSTTLTLDEYLETIEHHLSRHSSPPELLKGLTIAWASSGKEEALRQLKEFGPFSHASASRFLDLLVQQYCDVFQETWRMVKEARPNLDVGDPPPCQKKVASVVHNGEVYRQAIRTTPAEDVWFLIDDLADWRVYEPVQGTTFLLFKTEDEQRAQQLLDRVVTTIEEGRKPLGFLPHERWESGTYYWNHIDGGSVSASFDHHDALEVVVGVRTR